ncbi:MAG: hypothetical protein KDA96_07675, partial [Planctomycetaceae bacterium]|nr:hypothetical protein [Planctomycetaceae bacterium]
MKAKHQPIWILKALRPVADGAGQETRCVLRLSLIAAKTCTPAGKPLMEPVTSGCTFRLAGHATRVADI